ncbi:MAG: type I restriction endonuclease subunit M [Gammaproteobacteria bacterium]|nr:MAG: type I restriction endonuclease subunit M [Gammaproteobacteria bacterium]
MAIKKSDLYSSLWQSCDELRGGMDASQYKDYVLFMLFIKYVSDKYGNSDDFAPPVTIPEGASFKDMIALKGKSDIGDKINTQVIQPLIDANTRLARTDFPDFNDPNKLGEGKAMVDRLTNLVGIFEKPELDFSKNRADNDDILGDAYEYLMRHFATESGKSKGQFYTPAEVSRIMAKVIGISAANAVAATTAYDPTCGSGSLLLKVAAEAGTHITLEGQEMDVTTAGLARMNMILHDFPTANVLSGNTLSNPKFKDGEKLRTYDYVVANPPFSDKTWSTGLTPSSDPYQRFQWGEPPGKQGDYAYLLHIIRSMKSEAKGACILPHGVLFRGNAEAVIRKQLVRSGYLKGIIGLPANLFYGTSIPACILVLDKENASARKGIFMIDASKGFIKDGNKNRLRERDIHKIVDVFTNAEEHPGFSRLVPHAEIADPKNDFNLNLPRYIDTREAEDLQDIDAHLNGGIPARDIEALDDYWQVCPDLRSHLFADQRSGYCDLAVEKADLKAAIHEHSQFAAFIDGMNTHFTHWRDAAATSLKALQVDCLPKQVIHEQSESLLTHYEGQPLLDAYAVYQHLMDYWAETMQDDCYLIAADGWVAKTHRVTETVKSGKDKGKKKDKGWACDLAPKPLIVVRYFAEEQAAIDAQQAELETVVATKTELEDEHGGEEGALKDVSTKADAQVAHTQAIVALWNDEDKLACAAYLALIESAKDHAAHLKEFNDHEHLTPQKNAKGKLTLKAVKDRLATLSASEEHNTLSSYVNSDKAQKDTVREAREQLASVEFNFVARLSEYPLPENFRDLQAVTRYLELLEQEATLKKAIKEAEAALDQLAHDKYPELSEDEVKTLVVDDKWLTTLEAAIHGEMDRISQALTQRVKELADRYETPLPRMIDRLIGLEEKVNAHLERMGFTWK